MSGTSCDVGMTLFRSLGKEMSIVRHESAESCSDSRHTRAEKRREEDMIGSRDIQMYVCVRVMGLVLKEVEHSFARKPAYYPW